MTPAEPPDHQAITETVYRYALGIDTRDWALYRSIFADQITVDFSSYGGRPVATMRADEWVASVQPLFTGLAATQHTMTNPIVTVDGDNATCTMYMQATHALDHDNDDAWFTIGGYYTDTLRSTTGLWSITGVMLTVLWRRGDASIMAEAAKRGTATLQSF
jgi:SnoaL-like domain